MRTNIMAITTFLLGILSMLLCFIPYINIFGLALSIFSITLGVMTKGSTHKSNLSFYSIPILNSGITFGIIGIIIFIIAATVFVVSRIPV